MFLFKPMVATVALGALTACTAVGPDFVAPKANLSARFAFAPDDALRQAAASDWWHAFRDAQLDALVQRGLAQNLSIKGAQARIRESEALLRAAGVNSAVSGDLVASATATRTSGVPLTTNSSAVFAPAFLVDLFGGQARARQQAGAELAAAVYDKATARLGIQLAIVTAYLDLRLAEHALAVQQRAVSNRAEVVKNLKLRREVADVSQVEVRRAEAELATARAELPNQIAAQRIAILALSTLLAEDAGTVKSMVRKSQGIPVPRNGVRPGVPAELLRNRPDIRASESRYAAAVAAVGVAEADLYPSLRLGGSVTASSTDSVVFGPALTIPLLNRPTLAARRDAAKARVDQAHLTWQQTVLGALEEVQTALVRLEQADHRVVALGRAETTYRDAERLSGEAYDLDAITLLDLLDTQANLTSTQLQLAAARRAYGVAWAQLSVGIGQGWFVEEPLKETVQTAATQ
ncbi:efflux transporter outer membrane subunit [Pseudooceanicola sp.]|uniref:efflux transporter outer membrane subunit n=1 Tax=Pseudooceanicola sp. TaxID=1914328 RepID=UPI0035C66FE8